MHWQLGQMLNDIFQCIDHSITCASWFSILNIWPDQYIISIANLINCAICCFDALNIRPNAPWCSFFAPGPGFLIREGLLRGVIFAKRPCEGYPYADCIADVSRTWFLNRGWVEGATSPFTRCLSLRFTVWSTLDLFADCSFWSSRDPMWSDPVCRRCPQSRAYEHKKAVRRERTQVLID